MTALILRFMGDNSGATAIEYALIGALVSVGIIAAVTTLGGGMGALFNTIATKVSNSMNVHNIGAPG